MPKEEKQPIKEIAVKPQPVKELTLNAKRTLKVEKKKIPEEIKKLADERLRARKEKDWERADELRKEIKEKGWKVEDVDWGYDLSKI